MKIEYESKKKKRIWFNPVFFRSPAASPPSSCQGHVCRIIPVYIKKGVARPHYQGKLPKGNTCIFSTDFALKMMGDIQEYFITNNVRNFYSVSISGYHIAEAGANPITQLARLIWAKAMKYHYQANAMRMIRGEIEVSIYV